jgi:hypothetical protein
VTDRSRAQEGTPSVPVIFYLFADRIVPKHPLLVEGTSIPCTEVRVRSSRSRDAAIRGAPSRSRRAKAPNLLSELRRRCPQLLLQELSFRGALTFELSRLVA